MPGALVSKDFGPFTGYQSAVEPFMAGPDKLTTNALGGTYQSLDTEIDAFTGALYPRAGCSILGDTLSGNDEATGLTEEKWSARARQANRISSVSLTDGRSRPSVLFTKESNDASFPTKDTGYFGNQWLYDSNRSAGYNLLQEFSSTHYPGSTALASSPDVKWVPMWYESGDGGITRGAFKYARRFLTPGSRRTLDHFGRRYYPNLRGTPFRWNKRFNGATGSGSEPNRAWPTGPWAPLIEPAIAAGTSASGSDANWNDGDFFFFSVLFQFEDGSYSLPMIPRPVNGSFASGYLAVTVGTAGGTGKYRDLQWSHIPLGPDGTIARYLLRTKRQTWTSSAKTDPITVGVGDLRICGVLRNNTQTTYTDTNSNDNDLLDDPNVVRYDLRCPPRGRYYWTGDQRALTSYTLPNPCAIMLAPVSASTDFDLNVADTSSPGSTGFFVRVTSTQLELHYNPGAPPDFTVTTGNAKAFLFSTYTTLQSLVDAINATSRTGTPECKAWRAQLAPGVDGTIGTASALLATSISSSSSTSAASTALTIDSSTCARVALGMKIYDSNSKVAAGTYVTAKTSSTGLTLSTAASGSGSAAALEFYFDTGDEGTVSGGTHGYLRAYSPSLPVVLYFRRSAMEGYDKPKKSRIYFTISSPGAATTGVSLAPNAWGFADYRDVPDYYGQSMGGVDIEGAAICAFSGGIDLFINVRGVNSGEQYDYRMMPVNIDRGCVSFDSLVGAHGWAVYATRDGLVAVDKNRSEKVISNDVFNPGQRSGDLAYEIGKCVASSDADGDDEHLHVAVLGVRLAVTYRQTNAASLPNRRLLYDFSPGIESGGLAGILRSLQSGDAFGWSTPEKFNALAVQTGFSCMCAVPGTTNGFDFFGVSEANAGGTGDGRIDQMDTGTTDNGSSYTALAFFSLLLSDPLKNMRPIRMSALHSSPNGNASLALYNDGGLAMGGTLGSTNATLGNYNQQRILTTVRAKSLTSGLLLRWLSSVTGNKFYSVNVELESVPQ